MVNEILFCHVFTHICIMHKLFFFFLLWKNNTDKSAILGWTFFLFNQQYSLAKVPLKIENENICVEMLCSDHGDALFTGPKL